MQVSEAALNVLRRAIRTDLAGQRFYFDAATRCIDPWAKEVFVTLARWKEEQIGRVLAKYVSVRGFNGGNGQRPGKTRRATLDITQLTFRDDEDLEGPFPFQLAAAQLIDRRSDDLQALALGIDKERSVVELYRQARRVAEDREVRRAYEFLLRERLEYYHRLRNQWKELAGVPIADST